LFLFDASVSKRIRWRRIRSWLLVLGSLVLLTLSQWFRNESQHPYFLLALTFLTLVLYPFYLRALYKRHYLTHINEKLGNKLGIDFEIDFSGGYLFSSTDSSESKIQLSEIREIDEIREDLFIRLKSGDTVVLPAKMENYLHLKEILRETMNPLNVDWNKNLNWKWR